MDANQFPIHLLESFVWRATRCDTDNLYITFLSTREQKYFCSELIFAFQILTKTVKFRGSIIAVWQEKRAFF